jgi:hypothetical protein
MSETMLVELPDEGVLDRLEAEFLRSEVSFGQCHPEPLLRDAEIPLEGGQVIRGQRPSRMPTRGNGCCA